MKYEVYKKYCLIEHKSYNSVGKRGIILSNFSETSDCISGETIFDAQNWTIEDMKRWVDLGGQ